MISSPPGSAPSGIPAQAAESLRAEALEEGVGQAPGVPSGVTSPVA